MLTVADRKHEQALKRYNQRYDNHIYTIATQGLALETAVALSDDALALCGSPYYKLSRRRWSREAQRFLLLFA